MIQAAKPAHNWVKEWNKMNTPDPTKQSPEMNKKKNQRALKSPPNPPPDLDLPESAVKQNLGITEAVFQFLEMVEIMGQMTPLFQFYHQNPGLSPYAALDQYVQSTIPGPTGQNNMASNMATNMTSIMANSMANSMTNSMTNGQQMPQQGGPRTPGFGQFQVGASPAPAHQMLPGSPHVGSPAPGHMQAPSMQLQASQQGTSSSGPSANTSPSQGNKRRRPSAVKNEDDGPGSAPTPNAGATPQINGVQKKNPLTPRIANKRAKVNPT